jgi:delta(3,5)-delta(2,4)-dienoyl-CoA isomerase
MFSVREVQLGLAADVGTLQRFPKIVGHGSRVRELCFTGEDFNAYESARIGFVSRISEAGETLFDEAISICRRIANNSPVAVAGTKMSLNYSRDHNVKDGLENIAMHNAAALMTDDVILAFSNRNGAATFDSLIPHSKL